MKMKTLAMVAASGLMAISLAYITPVFAEDNFDDGMGGQQLAMADTGGAGIPSDSINGNENVSQSQQLAQQQPQQVQQQVQQQAQQQPPQQVQQQAQQKPQRMDTASNANSASPAPAATINPAVQAANPGAGDQPVADVASGDEDF